MTRHWWAWTTSSPLWMNATRFESTWTPWPSSFFGQTGDLRPGCHQQELNTSPHFYRWSWLPSPQASAMILNDPSLYASDDLLAGWWVSQRERDFVKEGVRLVAKAADALGIRNEDTKFYGASAGGYSPLAMATCLPGPRAVVGIPQVSLATYGAKVASDAWAHSQFSVETYSEWNLLKGGHFQLSRSVSLRRINEYIRSSRDSTKQPLARDSGFVSPKK